MVKWNHQVTPSFGSRVLILVSRPMAATHRKLTPCWKESPHQRNVATDAGATGAMSSRYQKCSPRFVQECYQVCMCHKGCKNINVFIQLCRSYVYVNITIYSSQHASLGLGCMNQCGSACVPSWIPPNSNLQEPRSSSPEFVQRLV